MNSINNLTITGFLAADAKTNGTSFARFTVLHNMGRKNDPVSIQFKMFAKKGKNAEELPLDALVKGAGVKVTAFLRANNYTNGDGEKIYSTDYIVKDLEFISKEVASEQDETEEQA